MTITAVTCTLEEAKAQVGQEGACLSGEEREITVLVHPKYTRDQVAGVKKELDALSRRYSKELGGVVVAYEKLRLMSASGWLFDTNPFIHFNVSARFIVFCPTVGDTLKAVVRKKSPHHLGCLAHGSFNISVPRPARESVNEWPGTLAAEGDTLTLSVLFTSLTSYLMPFIRAAIHPDCAKELREKAEAASVAEASGEIDGSSSSNTRVVFDDDSGISSNEAEENVKAQKRKRSEELEIEDEYDGSRKSKKQRKKDSDAEKEQSGMRKKKKKKIDVAVAHFGEEGKERSEVGEKNNEKSEITGKKRKRSEEEGDEGNKKKKKKRTSDYTEALEVKQERVKEEMITTPSKKKKKDKKKRLKQEWNLLEEEGEATSIHISEVSLPPGASSQEVTMVEEPPPHPIHARNTTNPFIKIKMEKMSSDEAEERVKSKKKKKMQHQDEGKEGDVWMKTLQNIKEEEIDENVRTESTNKTGKETRKVAARIKKERIQANEAMMQEPTSNTPTSNKKEKKKKKIKEERMSSDERRSLDNLPLPLFIIKREKGTTDDTITAKVKKEKG